MVEKIGLNMSKLNEMDFPTFNQTNIQEIIREAPRVANESTNGFLGWGVLISMFVIIYTTISERLGSGGFGYDEHRAFAITTGIVTIFGLLLVMVGFVYNFRPVGMFFGLFLLSSILIAYLENR